MPTWFNVNFFELIYIGEWKSSKHVVEIKRNLDIQEIIHRHPALIEIMSFIKKGMRLFHLENHVSRFLFVRQRKVCQRRQTFSIFFSEARVSSVVIKVNVCGHAKRVSL